MKGTLKDSQELVKTTQLGNTSLFLLCIYLITQNIYSGTHVSTYNYYVQISLKQSF